MYWCLHKADREAIHHVRQTSCIDACTKLIGRQYTTCARRHVLIFLKSNLTLKSTSPSYSSNDTFEKMFWQAQLKDMFQWLRKPINAIIDTILTYPCFFLYQSLVSHLFMLSLLFMVSPPTGVAILRSPPSRSLKAASGALALMLTGGAATASSVWVPELTIAKGGGLRLCT